MEPPSPRIGQQLIDTVEAEVGPDQAETLRALSDVGEHVLVILEGLNELRAADVPVPDPALRALAGLLERHDEPSR